MISSLRGIVSAVSGSTAVIEIAGIGLAVGITPPHALSLRVGEQTQVFTALIVREDDLSLFGFRSNDELAIFDLLRGVTGVGPKSALGVLAVMSPAEIAAAVTSENDAAFRKVTGIGPKTAKLIVLSLTGKTMMFAALSATTARSSVSSVNASVLAALVGLGWSERVATQAVDDALAAASEADKTTVAAILRLALSTLGPQGSAA